MRFPELAEFNESSASFRKDSIVFRNSELRVEGVEVNFYLKVIRMC